jgi:hypothetical protein
MSIWQVFLYVFIALVIGFVLFFILMLVLLSMGLKNKFGHIDQMKSKRTGAIEGTFNWVVRCLKALAKRLKLSYIEINIIVFYFVVPFSWLVLLDALFQFHYLSLAFLIFSLGFFVGCRDFLNFSTGLYRRSVNFLNYFNRFGSNYVASSVWLCLVLPLVIYALLIYLLLS